MMRSYPNERKIEEYVLNKLPEEFRLIHEALSRIEQKQKLKPKRYSGIPQKPKCLPIGNMEQFKAFEKINNEEFETVVSYFEYLGATLQNITPLLKASLDDGFSHTFTWYGNNEKLCMQDSVLIDTIYSAIANTAVCNKEEAPNYNEFKYAVNEALRTAKQRYRNRQKKSENNDTSKKHDKVFPKYHARYQRYNNDRDTDQSEEGDERCDIMDNDN